MLKFVIEERSCERKLTFSLILLVSYLMKDWLIIISLMILKVVSAWLTNQRFSGQGNSQNALSIDAL